MGSRVYGHGFLVLVVVVVVKMVLGACRNRWKVSYGGFCCKEVSPLQVAVFIRLVDESG